MSAAADEPVFYEQVQATSAGEVRRSLAISKGDLLASRSTASTGGAKEIASYTRERTGRQYWTRWVAMPDGSSVAWTSAIDPEGRTRQATEVRVRPDASRLTRHFIVAPDGARGMNEHVEVGADGSTVVRIVYFP
jgi:hypothetical protein